MRKCYIKDMEKEKEAFWEDFLGKTDLKNAFDFSYNKYAPKFDRFIPKDAKILEGGCGLGQYARYYTSRGFSVTGVDFSERLVEKARLLNSKAEFRVADISKLPFGDGSFDAYILNGVLEHFEEGVDKPLKEAWRVLKKGGVLIATLQYTNFARSIMDMFRKKIACYKGANIEGIYKVVNDFKVENGSRFHSYFFNKKEAKKMFSAFGGGKHDFKVIRTMPLSVENGLGDYRWFRHLTKNRFTHFQGVSTVDKPFYTLPRCVNGKNPVKEWVKRTFIQEEAHDPVGFVLLKLLQECFGSMIMVVCKKFNANGR